VACATTHLHRGTLGLFGIGTIERARRRGIGTAVTAFAIRDHRTEADLAWLEPTAMARRLYERLGFRAVSTWEVWVRPRMNGA
jgi:ribosomal protein S18 acetylase RimI-like enzyme